MSWRIWTLGLVALVETIVVVVLVLVLVSARRRAEEFEAAATELHTYCKLVHAALEIDRDELRDPASQHSASFRFYEGYTGHSYREIVMCAKRRPALSRHDSCLIAGDYECLAELASAAEQEVAAALSE